MRNKNEPTQTLFDLIESGFSYLTYESGTKFGTLEETISLDNNSPTYVEAYSFGGDLGTILGNSEVVTIPPHTRGYIKRKALTNVALPSANQLKAKVNISYSGNSEVREVVVENQTSLE